jgi:hypothetical protein
MLRNSVSGRNLIIISLVLLVLAAPFAAMPRAAQAEEVPFKGTFTVQPELLTVTANCAPGDTNCTACITNSGIYIDAQGIGDTSVGTLYFEILKCFYPARGSFGTFVGTFTMSAPNGKDSIKGTYTGGGDSAGDAYGFGPFSGELTITGGNGKFDGAKGSASFTAVAGPNAPGPNPNSNVGMAFYSVKGMLELRGDD